MLVCVCVCVCVCGCDVLTLNPSQPSVTPNAAEPNNVKVTEVADSALPDTKKPPTGTEGVPSQLAGDAAAPPPKVSDATDGARKSAEVVGKEDAASNPVQPAAVATQVAEAVSTKSPEAVHKVPPPVKEKPHHSTVRVLLVCHPPPNH